MTISHSSDKKTVNVLVPYPVGKPYSYLMGDADLGVGDFVLVPIGRRQSVGVVHSLGAPDVDLSRLKPVMDRFPVPPMPESQLRLLDWIAKYTMADVGSVLKMH